MQYADPEECYNSDLKVCGWCESFDLSTRSAA